MGRIIINASHYEPKPIVGYADQVSVAPGDTVGFHVSCDGAASFSAQITRLVHGDLHPDGPGFREELVECSANGTYPGRKQETSLGSSMVVDAPGAGEWTDAGMTVQAMICATTPSLGRDQSLVARWDEAANEGWALYIDTSGHLSFKMAGEGSREAISASLDTPLLTRVWYLVSLVVEPGSRSIRLAQQPVLGPFNGRLVWEHPEADMGETRTFPMPVDAPVGGGALRIAAWQEGTGRRGAPVAGAFFNGKIDRPRVSARALTEADVSRAVESPMHTTNVWAAWDFAANITDSGFARHDVVRDVGPGQRHGRLLNLPTRAVTGYNWNGSEVNFRHAPAQYGAIHFHDDDLADCEWEKSFELTVTDDMHSGVYAARVRADVQGVLEEDYLVFFVRPADTGPRNRIVFVAPTMSYLAYANDHMAATSEWGEVLWGSVPHLGELDLARQQHLEYGKSLYDLHRDGSGVCYSSWLRPILTMRPKYRPALAQVWQFNADLHLIDWFQSMGYDIDVITDHDIHARGMTILEPYKVVVTGTHPEYVSASMVDAFHDYVSDGGRLMYMGGNGFYWVTEFGRDDPRVVEVRRTAGTEAWTAEPGQAYSSFTGDLGGTWRSRGRAPQKLLGVGFIAQGLDLSTYFVRNEDSFAPDAAWIMEGVSDDERIGDFGLSQGGAGGIEVDWFDPALGSPGWARVVASTEGLSRLMLEVKENVLETMPFLGGDLNPNVRADLTYFRVRGGGGVFSTGSIAWCGSLSHNGYANNVSTITKNVVDRFVSDEPLP